jgi:hypothetical protein
MPPSKPRLLRRCPLAAKNFFNGKAQILSDGLRNTTSFKGFL